MALYKKQELVDRLVRVLHNAADALTRLDRYTEYWEDEQGAFLRQQDKVAAEATLLAFLAGRVPHDGDRLPEAIAALVTECERHVATSRNEALLRRFPQTATTLGAGFVLLDKLGREQPHIIPLLRYSFERRLATMAERGTFRLMDLRWTFGLLDPELVGPVEELLPLSTLSASPHPIYTMNEDDYALTHALYYLTDFGRRPPPPSLQGNARQLLDPFLAANAVRLNLDLLGEFLICGIVMRVPPSAALRFAWRLFFQAWAEEGGLVGPDFSAARLAELEGEEAEAYAFAENYHTRFVGGILCAVALATAGVGESADGEGGPSSWEPFAARYAQAAERARGVVPPAAQARELSRPAQGELLEWIISRLLLVQRTIPGSSQRWLQVALASDLQRADLAPFLYDALLVVAAREYHLAQLGEALAVGAGEEMLRTPTFAVALEFLLDQQLESGKVGIHHLLDGSQDGRSLAEVQATLAALLPEISRGLRE